MHSCTLPIEKCTRGVAISLLQQVNAAERAREARAQLLAAKARHDKLVAARRTVEALQSALQAGQTQVHRHRCAFFSSFDIIIYYLLLFLYLLFCLYLLFPLMTL